MIDVILSPIDNMIHSLAKMLGNPDDQTRLLILIFAAYPLGYLFRFISGKWTRHAYSILAGVMIHYIMFREQVIHFWLLGLIVYLIISFIDRKIQAPIVFIVCLAHLSIVHIMRVIYDYGGWSIDCSTFLMPLVSRLSSLGYCYYDGIEERKNDLLEEQESRKLIRKPTLIEILSYVSFPASNLCGPFFEFRDYIDFIEENGRFKNIPSSFRHVSRSLFLGIINIILCIVLIDSFNIFDIAKEEMMNKPFIYKWAFCFIACFVYRTKFYVVWNLADGSIHLSGLSYNGEDEKGNPRFDKIQCCDMLGVELCTSPREGIRCWNTMTTEWLRHYVFNRIRSKESKDNTIPTFLTNLLSGFWHGFYPIYYPTFFFLAFVSEIGKDLYRKRELFSFIPNFVSAILSNLLIMTALNYVCSGLILLEMSKALAFYKDVYFYGHFALIFAFIAARYLLPNKARRSKVNGEVKQSKIKTK